MNLVEYEGFALDENLRYTHVKDGGRVLGASYCTECGAVFPDKPWMHLRKIRIMLDPFYSSFYDWNKG